MSTIDYSRYVDMGKRLVSKFGNSGKLEQTIVVTNPDEPWNDSETKTVVIDNFQCVVTDYVKRFNKKGALVTSQQTAYIETSNLTDVTQISTQSKLIFGGITWSVKDSEVIRPDGKTTALIILWVDRYG